ncbi:MAG: hypothetical protein KatS3mg076_2952 [Candidatus Binatia bacterium]|nr:MAG: hypothetical protein KatS3mg076_2952 [Candidatus Binatia bacterium]
MISQLFGRGGAIVWVLFFLSVVSLGIVSAKTILLLGYRYRLRRFRCGTYEGPLRCPDPFALARGLTTLRVVGGLAPLLGLLGTVIGLFRAFQAVAASGLGDPAVFAEGVSLALTTTIAGLLVAAPTIAAYQYLTAASERLLAEFEGLGTAQPGLEGK